MKKNYIDDEMLYINKKFNNRIDNYINGDFKYTAKEKTLGVFSPINGKKIIDVVMSDADDLKNLINEIEPVQKKWASLTFKKRADVMYKYRELLIENKSKLALIIHLENGKCINDATAEINKAIETVELACSMPNIAAGGYEEVSNNVWAMNDYRALGIVSSIAPFNFPIMVPHWTIAHAMVMGNAMILKPSEQTPISSSMIAELWKEAGLPNGIFNIINGGKEIVEAICEEEKIKAISFVGSTNIAKIVYQKGSYNFKRVLALGGAKNFILVMPDSPIEATVRDVISSAYGMVGQRCMAASVIVDVGHNLKIESKLIEKLQNMKVFANADYTEGLSPVSSIENFKNIEKYIDNSKKLGAKILVNGLEFKPEDEDFKEGYYIGPTLIDWRGIEEKMDPNEIFGPVLELMGADDLESAIAIQNNNPYGNAASIFTGDGEAAFKAIKGFTAGMLGINIGVPVPREPFSFGGMKLSKFGHGDITGPSANEFWSNSVKVAMKWNPNDKKDWLS